MQIDTPDMERRRKSKFSLPPAFRSPLLKGLAPAEAQRIFNGARHRTICNNQVLQYEGDPATSLSLLVSGIAAFYKVTAKGHRVFLRWITPGDVFGLSTLHFAAAPYLATVHSLTDGILLVWTRDLALNLVHQFPQLRDNIHAITRDHFQYLADSLVTRTYQSAGERVAHMLVETADRIGNVTSRGIEFALTNEQLAEMAGVSLFTASRYLAVWHKKNIIAKGRGRILLRDRHLLGAQ